MIYINNHSWCVCLLECPIHLGYSITFSRIISFTEKLPQIFAVGEMTPKKNQVGQLCRKRRRQLTKNPKTVNEQATASVRRHRAASTPRNNRNKRYNTVKTHIPTARPRACIGQQPTLDSTQSRERSTLLCATARRSMVRYDILLVALLGCRQLFKSFSALRSFCSNWKLQQSIENAQLHNHSTIRVHLTSSESAIEEKELATTEATGSGVDENRLATQFQIFNSRLTFSEWHTQVEFRQYS